jgi:metal-dependent amidase/aminoacylase/carboxypeptidase family protein
MLIDEIRQKANEIALKVTGYRRYLHAHPELSFKEY